MLFRSMQGELTRPLFELSDRDLLQEGHRIVIEGSPAGWVKLPKEACRIRIPTPPEVLRQLIQVVVCRRNDLACVRASPTMGASWVPAIVRRLTSSDRKERASLV